jgi:hypothetical protein
VFGVEKDLAAAVGTERILDCPRYVRLSSLRRWKMLRPQIDPPRLEICGPVADGPVAATGPSFTADECILRPLTIPWRSAPEGFIGGNALTNGLT